jgi:hypothetical protein
VKNSYAHGKKQVNNNEFEVKYLKEFSVIENDKWISMEAEIELHDIIKTVSVLLTNTAIKAIEIEQCKTIIDNFLKMFDGEKFGIIPMHDVVKQTDFSNMVLDCENGIPTLLVHYVSGKVIVEFNKEYDVEKWGVDLSALGLDGVLIRTMFCIIFLFQLLTLLIKL